MAQSNTDWTLEIAKGIAIFMAGFVASFMRDRGPLSQGSTEGVHDGRRSPCKPGRHFHLLDTSLESSGLQAEDGLLTAEVRELRTATADISENRRFD